MATIRLTPVMLQRVILGEGLGSQLGRVVETHVEPPGLAEEEGTGLGGLVTAAVGLGQES